MHGAGQRGDCSTVGAVMAVYAAKEMNARNVAVVDDLTAYGQGLAAEFVAEAKRQNLNVVKQEFTTDKATDFTAILISIRSAKPDAVVDRGRPRLHRQVQNHLPARSADLRGRLLRRRHAAGASHAKAMNRFYQPASLQL